MRLLNDIDENNKWLNANERNIKRTSIPRNERTNGPVIKEPASMKTADCVYAII